MNYCIPKDLIDQLKPRMKEVGGAKLVSMSSKDLTTFFSETVGDKLGAEVAKSFRKASLSHNKNAMKAWAKKTLTIGEAKEVDKIADEMTEDDSVYDTIDGDVIERVLGVDISPEEVDTINKLTEKMFDAYKRESDNIFSGIHTDYFKAEKELNDYLDTVNSMSNLEVLTRIIFRGNLLFAPKSIVTNIIGNTSGGVSEKLVNTALERKFSGVNGDLIQDYIYYAVNTYGASGIDVVRAMEANTSSTVLGEHFQGVGNEKGLVRGYGRFIDQYVFRYGQGTPDIAFASLHFADNINILSTKFADAKSKPTKENPNGWSEKQHKDEARRLFLMATSLTLNPNNPDHAEALQIKRTALQYALTSTYQNQTAWVDATLKVRSVLDEYTGDLNLGTNLVPFVKTLVNIAKLSIDMTGITLPIEVPRLVIAYKNGDAETMRKTINVAIRAGFGMTLAFLLAGLLDDDDYLPDYTIATDYQKQIAKLANAPYNSIRIGDKWVSLAYFGTFGYALAGMLGARPKVGASETVTTYYKNTLLQLRQTPVIQQILDTYDYMNDVTKYNKTGEDIRDEAIAGTANFFLSRLIPSITLDIAKGTDDKERFTRYGIEGISDQLKNKIPFWREVLPPKYNALGDTIPTENWYWIILTGSRFKSAPADTQVYSELVKLSVSGEDVSIKLDSFQDVKIAKKLLSGREYNELTGQLQKELSNSYANIMSTDKYKKEENPEKKKKYLTDVRDNVAERVLKQSGYYARIQREKAMEKRIKKLNQ